MNKRIRKKHKDRKAEQAKALQKYLTFVAKLVRDNWDSKKVLEQIDTSKLSPMAQAMLPALTYECPPFTLSINAKEKIK